MFGIGFMEFVLIAVVCLVFFGPKKLPEIMQQLARLFVQVRRMSNEAKSAFDTVIQDAEREMRKEELQKELRAIVQQAHGDGQQTLLAVKAAFAPPAHAQPRWDTEPATVPLPPPAAQLPELAMPPAPTLVKVPEASSPTISL